MPAKTRRQQRFMQAEYGRAKAGEKTETGMSKSQLRDFAKGPIKKKRKK
jgi:hypothetical protein